MIAQNLDGKYRKIGVLTFSTGVILSLLGEFELIAILLKLSPTVIPKLIPHGTALFSAVFYLILGNSILLIEYMLFRKRKSKL
jgi:hypothetical protein